jgi:hypothetical protein
MALFSKTTKTPSHTERLAGLAATKEAALSVFAVAAQDLESVASEAAEVFNDIDFQIGHLRDVQGEVAEQHAEAKNKARLIRESFLGG